MIRKVLLSVTVGLTLLGAAGLPAAEASTSSATTTARPAGRDHAGHDRAGPDHGRRDHDGAYLALGDSVPFGYDPLVPVGSNPNSYVGYPELVSRRLRLRLTNLSCPGQTTGGYLSLTGDDNGCFAFRSAAALHASYRGSQSAAALAFLSSHRNTRLVTIMLGANDLFLCEKATSDTCTSPAEVAATLQTAAAHLTVALTAIRRVYSGPLIAVTYYSTDYTNTSMVAAVSALDATLASVTSAFGGTVADAFTPFRVASAASGGSPCAAGLLIPLSTGGCDVHPTRRGALILARALLTAVKAADRRHAA